MISQKSGSGGLSFLREFGRGEVMMMERRGRRLKGVDYRLKGWSFEWYAVVV
jgi:hypothetical protein